MEPQRCDGCGQMTTRRIAVDVCPTVTRRVCAHGGHTDLRPKESCVDKARATVRGCPGCGAELALSEWRSRRLCSTCANLLGRARETTDGPLVWGQLDPTRLLGECLVATRERIEC